MPFNTKGIIKLLSAGLLTAFMASGCASFPGRELPIYTKGQLSAPEKKIFASYDVKAYGPKGNKVAMAAANLDQRIQQVLSATPIFENLKPGYKQGDYQLSFVLQNDGMPSEVVAFINGYLSGFTLTVILTFPPKTEPLQT